MTTIHWFILIGCLMLARGLMATSISRLPFTSAIVYLCVGLGLGPMVLGIFSFSPVAQSHLLETLTEIAVLVSLFSAGVKMPVPISRQRWMPAIRLAWVSMSLSVGLIAAFCYYVLNLPLGAGVLLGAILAPTDPVLATDVQVRHPDDRDKLRFTLTCEAGMNDGSAFPFVMLGLGLLGVHELGDFGWRWVLVDVLWATLAAIAIGTLGGAALGRIGWMLRGKDPKHEVLDDLVGLGLIGVVYGLSVVFVAWGFLAVFFAGVALRQTELVLSGAHKDRQGLLVPDKPRDDAGAAAAGAGASEAEAWGAGAPGTEASGAGAPGTEASAAGAPGTEASGAGASGAQAPPVEVPLTVSAESLVFKEHLERLSELTLVLLLGGMVSMHDWNWRSVGTALFLFAIARPLSVMIGLAGSDSSMRIRGITAWFGVRGIGSLYYLMYALNHGLPAALARELIPITVVVIMLSILVHGTSVKPLLDRFWKRKPG